jgi:hypothetical protein
MIQIRVDQDKITGDEELVQLITLMSLLGDILQDPQIMMMGIFSVMTQCLYDDETESFLDTGEAQAYIIKMSADEFMVATSIMAEQLSNLNTEMRLEPFKAKFEDRL